MIQKQLGEHYKGGEISCIVRVERWKFVLQCLAWLWPPVGRLDLSVTVQMWAGEQHRGWKAGWRLWPAYKETFITLRLLEMLALMSPQVIRSVWGRRREEKLSEPGENRTLLEEQRETIETISLAISDTPAGEARGKARGTDEVTRVTNELANFLFISLTSSEKTPHL